MTAVLAVGLFVLSLELPMVLLSTSTGSYETVALFLTAPWIIGYASVVDMSIAFPTGSNGCLRRARHAAVPGDETLHANPAGRVVDAWGRVKCGGPPGGIRTPDLLIRSQSL